MLYIVTSPHHRPARGPSPYQLEDLGFVASEDMKVGYSGKGSTGSGEGSDTWIQHSRQTAHSLGTGRRRIWRTFPLPQVKVSRATMTMTRSFLTQRTASHTREQTLSIAFPLLNDVDEFGPILLAGHDCSGFIGLCKSFSSYPWAWSCA